MKNNEKWFGYVTLALVLIWMLVIFLFSAETGEQSSETSHVFVDAVVSVLYPDLDSMTPEQQMTVRDQVTFWVRKTGHFSEYALLGLLCMLHFHSVACYAAKYDDFRYMGRRIHVKHLGRFSVSRSLPVWSWAVGTAYAASDEFHQLFVENRGPSVRDVAIDSAGVLFGVFVAVCFTYWFWYRSFRRSRLW